MMVMSGDGARDSMGGILGYMAACGGMGLTIHLGCDQVEGWR